MERNMIAGEVEMSYKSYSKRDELYSIENITDVRNVSTQFFCNIMNYKEKMIAIYLNQRNRVLGVCTISEGGINGTVCDVRLVFQSGLLLNATGLILVHNHPSGNRNSSNEDLKITKQIKEAGMIMNIRLIDSCIIVEDDIISIIENANDF